jgi:hypothetical protein
VIRTLYISKEAVTIHCTVAVKDEQIVRGFIFIYSNINAYYFLSNNPKCLLSVPMIGLDIFRSCHPSTCFEVQQHECNTQYVLFIQHLEVAQITTMPLLLAFDPFHQLSLLPAGDGPVALQTPICFFGRFRILFSMNARLFSRFLLNFKSSKISQISSPRRRRSAALGKFAPH